MKKTSEKCVLVLTRLAIKKWGSFEKFLLQYSQSYISENINVVLTLREEPQACIRSTFENFNINLKIVSFNKRLDCIISILKILLYYRPTTVFTAFISIMHPSLFIMKFIGVKKVIYTIHSIDSEKWKNLKKRKIKILGNNYFVNLRQKICIKSIDHFIAVSNFIKDRAIEKYKIPKNKIMTIYNGISQNSVSTLKTSDKKNHTSTTIFDGKESKNFKIACVGNIVHKKGFQIVLFALKLLENKFDNIDLTIIGDGEYLTVLKKLGSELNIKSKIHFLGYRNDVVNILRYMDVIIIPSICDEAFAYVTLEGMSVGKPVIGSNIGGIPETIIDDVNGYLFQPGDYVELFNKLTLLMLNPKKKDELGKNTKIIFDSKFTLQQQIKLYRNLDNL